MIYRWYYETPAELDDLVILSDGTSLLEISFTNKTGQNDEELPIYQETVKWLDTYFSGKDPGFIPACTISKHSPFRQRVYEILKTIPYGKTTTYGQIAKIIAEERGILRMAAQAIGQAVGANPVCIIIPCHRVIGSDGSLIGYGGGIRNKAALLRLEQLNSQQN